MANNFNFIAPIYDFLANLILGKQLIECQTFFLSEIKESYTVLILGGGTGKLLEMLPKCKEVHFLDLSVKMIKQARKRDCKSPINFIHADSLKHDFESTYDVIICPFFLDCFGKENLLQMLAKSRGLLKVTGRFIVTDFNHEANPTLLKLMHLFFRFTANLESNKLLNLERIISDAGFEQTQIKNFKKGIFSAIYKKVL